MSGCIKYFENGSVDSKVDKKNIHKEQCKYKVKKREIKSFIDYVMDLDSDYEID